MQHARPHYLSYLVRLWQASDEGEVTWRASVESAHTGERRAFSSLAELFAYLEERTYRLPGQEAPHEASGALPEEGPQADTTGETT